MCSIIIELRLSFKFFLIYYQLCKQRGLLVFPKAPFTRSRMRRQIIPDHRSVMVRDSLWWSVTNHDKPCTNRVNTELHPGPSGSEHKKVNMFDFSPGWKSTVLVRCITREVPCSHRSDRVRTGTIRVWIFSIDEHGCTGMWIVHGLISDITRSVTVWPRISTQRRKILFICGHPHMSVNQPCKDRQLCEHATMDQGLSRDVHVYHLYRNCHSPCRHHEKTVLTPVLEIKSAGSPLTTKILHLVSTGIWSGNV
jgi:hypothetical protein